AISPVFTNLITNSIKHGKAKNINIEVTSKNDMCEIRFIDDGVGIPDKIKFKIFQEGFYYGKTGHTGIGLHIVKKTIDRYGGYIYAENNKPKGAVFVIGLKKVIAHKSDG
ncbi:MAG: HAMP domain-containing histidine kinase, partial [Candidatus Cloacimonetes bacterium]|nr:HAMP domain-containing histidine kinase [Candidatus Cloacimonadota bacterium]